MKTYDFVLIPYDTHYAFTTTIAFFYNFCWQTDFIAASRNRKHIPIVWESITTISHTHRNREPDLHYSCTHSHSDSRSADPFTSIHNLYNSNNNFSFNYSGSCAHAQQLHSSYQSAKQSNGERINTSDTVEYALSKGTATEICIGSTTEQPHHCCRTTTSSNLNNNNRSNNCSQHTSYTMSENRDRLGLWGTATVDSEVAGNISGLQRLHLARFNKVSVAFFVFFFYVKFVRQPLIA